MSENPSALRYSLQSNGEASISRTLLACGKGVDALAVVRPVKRDEAEESCAGDMGQRMRAALGGLGVQEDGGEMSVKRVGRGDGLYLRGGQR